MKFRVLEPYEQEQKVDPKSIPGKRFRRQFFTLPLLITVLLFLYLPYLISILMIAFGDFSLSDLAKIIATQSIILLPLMLLFTVLWILNRRFFGRIICVSTDKWIYHAGGLIHGNRYRAWRMKFNCRTRASICLRNSAFATRS